MDAVCSLIRKRLIKITGDDVPARAVVELTGDAMQMAKENAFILDSLSDEEDDQAE